MLSNENLFKVRGLRTLNLVLLSGRIWDSENSIYLLVHLLLYERVLLNISLHNWIRLNALYSGSVLNTGNRPLYTMDGHFARFTFTHWWAALRPLGPLQTYGPLHGLFPVFSTLLEFSAFTLYISAIYFTEILDMKVL